MCGQRERPVYSKRPLTLPADPDINYDTYAIRAFRKVA